MPPLQLFVEMSLVISYLHIHLSSPQQTRLPQAAFQDIELAVLHKCQYVIFAGVSKCVTKSLLNCTLYPLGSSLLFSLNWKGLS